MLHLDIASNRATRKWTRLELVGRVLWSCLQPLFRWSPRLCWGWRRFLLRLFGAKIGKKVQIHPSVQIFIPWNLSIGDWASVGFDALLYNLGPMSIGERVTISQRAHLCGGSHDFRDTSMPLIKLEVVVNDDAWICADAFIGPNVIIGKSAVIGARAVVMKNVDHEAIVVGNPAVVVGRRYDKRSK